jgi:hypothetical protein
MVKEGWTSESEAWVLMLKPLGVDGAHGPG